ncbi:uncharacterized protein LOC112592365 [Melanaphis sacchari]|uniref:uncharacterized protein LOC112592365 n=1 Tax=Melanaphis sacchari TaxID=742174 RepID=UPI000DC15204|nr:uncharacterized protein LOC112592365 [Melanaphis sacchari]
MNPIYDPIVLLLEHPYRRWSTFDKNDLLRKGKPTPSLTHLSADKNGSKRLFCWPCILLSQSNSVWITLGYADFKNLSRSILRHEVSKDHVHNYLNLKNLEKNTTSIIDTISEHGKLFKLCFNENVRLNRLCMEHIIDLVLFLAKQELAFRGHDESSNSINKDNFRELVELHFSRCSLEVQNHYKSLQNKFTGTSKIIQNEIILCISEYLSDHIKHEIKQCMFYSIQIDDTTDITQKTQCSVILRYITNKSELVERFFGFYDVRKNHTAEGLFNLITSLLLEFNIEKKLVGQCYDGACVMAGNLNGLQARIKEIAPNALFTHCYAHKLNLVLQHGCNSNKTCRIFFANIIGISAFFHNSTSRTNVVDSIIGKRIPQFVQTRWASRSKIVHLLVKEWINFKAVFGAIINDPKSSADSICGSEVMPEVYKLFSLILTIPSTSVSVERSFSCLKRIKTYLRNNTSQHRLNSLSTISIEKLLIQQLKENEPFYEEIINIYASKKDRTIVLIYKINLKIPKLQKNTMPCLFPGPKYLSNPQKKRKSPTKRVSLGSNCRNSKSIKLTEVDSKLSETVINKDVLNQETSEFHKSSIISTIEYFKNMCREIELTKLPDNWKYEINRCKNTNITFYTVQCYENEVGLFIEKQISLETDMIVKCKLYDVFVNIQDICPKLKVLTFDELILIINAVNTKQVCKGGPLVKKFYGITVDCADIVQNH